MAIEAQGLEIQDRCAHAAHPPTSTLLKYKIGLAGRNGAGKTTLTRA